MPTKTVNPFNPERMEAQTTPQRLKIADRPDLARRWMQGVKDLAETENRLADLYSRLQIGEFTAAALADVYSTGGAEARRLYLAAAKEDAAKVRSNAIRAQIEQEAEQWRTPFADAARKAKQDADQSGSEARYLLQFLTLGTDGRFTLADDTAQRITDAAAVYLTEPDEIEKYRQHAAAVEALNAFFEDGATAPAIWYSVFEMGADGRIKMPSAGTNYAYLLNLKKRREAEAATAAAAPTMSETSAAMPQPKHPTAARMKVDRPTAPPHRAAQPETNEQPQTSAKAQTNATKATAPRMVTGISKEPDQYNRGAEMRQGKHRSSPDSGE